MSLSSDIISILLDHSKTNSLETAIKQMNVPSSLHSVVTDQVCSSIGFCPSCNLWMSVEDVYDDSCINCDEDY